MISILDSMMFILDSMMFILDSMMFILDSMMFILDSMMFILVQWCSRCPPCQLPAFKEVQTHVLLPGLIGTAPIDRKLSDLLHFCFHDVGQEGRHAAPSCSKWNLSLLS
jgi:hypothetical protein